MNWKAGCWAFAHERGSEATRTAGAAHHGGPFWGVPGDTTWSLGGHPRGGLTGGGRGHDLPPVGSACPPLNRGRSGEGL